MLGKKTKTTNETIPEFKSRVYKVHNKHIKQGLDEFKQLLILVTEWIEKQ